MIPATREGVAILPFRRDRSFSRHFMAPHFVAAVNVGGFLYDFKLRGDEFQALYGFLCSNLIFRIVARAVTLCPRQLVLGQFGCLKRGKVFFFCRNVFSSYNKNRSNPEGLLLNGICSISLVCWLEQIYTTKQQIYQIAMENSVVIIEIVRNIHANNYFFEKVLCQYQRCKFRGFLFVRIHLEG